MSDKPYKKHYERMTENFIRGVNRRRKARNQLGLDNVDKAYSQYAKGSATKEQKRQAKNSASGPTKSPERNTTGIAQPGMSKKQFKTGRK